MLMLRKLKESSFSYCRSSYPLSSSWDADCRRRSTHHDGKKISGGKFDIDVLQDRIRIRDYVQQIGLPALFVQCGVSRSYSARSLDYSIADGCSFQMYFELVYMFDLAKVNSDGTITFNSCRAEYVHSRPLTSTTFPFLERRY